MGEPRSRVRVTGLMRVGEFALAGAPRPITGVISLMASRPQTRNLRIHNGSQSFWRIVRYVSRRPTRQRPIGRILWRLPIYWPPMGCRWLS